MFNRKHSIDLLDGLDLDFMNVNDMEDDELFKLGGFFPERGFSFDHSLNPNGSENGENFDLLKMEPNALNESKGIPFDREWFNRRMSIGSNGNGASKSRLNSLNSLTIKEDGDLFDWQSNSFLFDDNFMDVKVDSLGNVPGGELGFGLNGTSDSVGGLGMGKECAFGPSGGLGEIDMSAYSSHAAKLQQQNDKNVGLKKINKVVC
jgi:hypothetical protein